MAWYVAHVIMYVKYTDIQHQKEYPVWENLYLINATSDIEALKKAEMKGKAEEGDFDPSFKWNKVSATWVFGGVRKLVKCENDPADLVELSYNEMTIKAWELDNLINGKKVKAVIDKVFDDTESPQPQESAWQN